MTNNQKNSTARLRSGWRFTIHPASDIVQGKVYKELASTHEFAILSENAYAKSEEYDDAPDWHLKERGKRILVPGWAWKEIKEIPDFPTVPDGKVKMDGLACSVWEKETEEEITTAIVFLGTVDKNDWKANARWFTTLFFSKWWDQYHQTQTLIKPLVEFIVQRAEEKGKKFSIVTTGHSLGGGLAQQAAYACDKIKLVVAFDPSPVTGFYDIPRGERDLNKRGIKVFRIYEKGEILAYFRNIMRFLYPAPLLKTQDPAIYELRFDVLTNDGFASQHSMRHFAKALYDIKNQIDTRKAD